MHRRIAWIAGLAALCAALAVPTAASAARRRARTVKAPTAAQVIRNCTNSSTGNLTRPYSVRVLRLARKRIRGDVAEYTGCYDAVRAALRSARSRIVVGIRKRSRGGWVAGQVVVRDRRGRVVDAIRVRRGKRVTIGVPRGTYKLQAGRIRGCVRTVRIRHRRTLRTAIVCSRA